MEARQLTPLGSRELASSLQSPASSLIRQTPRARRSLAIEDREGWLTCSSPQRLASPFVAIDARKRGIKRSCHSCISWLTLGLSYFLNHEIHEAHEKRDAVVGFGDWESNFRVIRVFRG